MLEDDEPHPVTTVRDVATSEFFLTCDHASNRIPSALNGLGLQDTETERHIAWDIGAAGVSMHLSRQLDATLVMQNYSRLVVDCNRPKSSGQLVPTVSEATAIPGNQGVDFDAIDERYERFHQPYHNEITRLLDGRAQRQQPTILVAIHSFTPAYLGENRPWHLGVLYGKSENFARRVFSALDCHDDIEIGDNEPYRIDHEDYGIPVHGEARGIPHVLLEIRQDLIASKRGQEDWARRLAKILTDALVLNPAS